MVNEPAQDWTTGPAKLAAAVVLGAAAIAGMSWSITTRVPASARAGQSIAAAAPASSVVPTGQQPAPARIEKLINLNTASAAELELLPGIGPAMAERIIAYRDSRGPFRSVNELDRVDGIGSRTIERLRDKVTLE